MATLTYIQFDDLRAALREAGLTQNDVSYRTGIDQGQISRYVTGAAVPSPRNAAKIAEALGMRKQTVTVGKVRVSQDA